MSINSWNVKNHAIVTNDKSLKTAHRKCKYNHATASKMADAAEYKPWYLLPEQRINNGTSADTNI